MKGSAHQLPCHPTCSAGPWGCPGRETKTIKTGLSKKNIKNRVFPNLALLDPTTRFESRKRWHLAKCSGEALKCQFSQWTSQQRSPPNAVTASRWCSRPLWLLLLHENRGLSTLAILCSTLVNFVAFHFFHFDWISVLHGPSCARNNVRDGWDGQWQLCLLISCGVRSWLFLGTVASDNGRAKQLSHAVAKVNTGTCVRLGYNTLTVVVGDSWPAQVASVAIDDGEEAHTINLC